MLVLLTLSIALTVGLIVYAAAQLVPARPRRVAHQLEEIQRIGGEDYTRQRRRGRKSRREMVQSALEVLGGKLSAVQDADGATRRMLVHAGYRRPEAAALYWGIRFALAVGLALLMLFGLPLAGMRPAIGVFGAMYMGAMGWILPVLWVRQKRVRRQKEIQLALADALDLLVVCVEAGLGLNQALLRVAEEIRHVSELLSLELAAVNLEIRAGTPRDTALRNLAERTGVEDIRGLVTMLIQTDRFGTSIAQSLRVHSDTLRMKRRQRAEEAAAKTTIKLVFPLVICIFPAMFVVLIGPGLIMIIRALSGIG